MARPSQNVWRWREARGLSIRQTGPEMLPGLCSVATNVQLQPGVLGRRRYSTVALSLTSGPATAILQFLVHKPVSSGTPSPELWAFTASTAHRYASASWSTVTLIDTPAASTIPVGVTLNNKFFLCYNSGSNRLHLWDGSAVRRVGLGVPSAPTAANSGVGGAYAATARYYRVSFRIKSGSDVVCESELSPAVSFTPDGTKDAAVVTKPTTVDSATHWVVWGLIGSSGDTYDLYEELSEIVVATTTYSDSTAPASYAGDAPASLGMHIPPPSAKFIVTDGNRLVMAGAYESSASTGETVPKNSRVWFTRVLGASDNGDDETIPNVFGVQTNWIDVGENDGDVILGLAAVESVVYVFKSQHIYVMEPTSIDTAPYRVRLLAKGMGLVYGGSLPHRTIVVSRDAVYFNTRLGMHRILGGVIERVGFDLTSSAETAPTMEQGVWDQTLGQCVWLTSSSSNLYVYRPEMASPAPEGYRGGWMKWTATAMSTPTTICMFAIDGGFNAEYLTWGGAHSAAVKAEYFGSPLAPDAGGTYTAQITSWPLRVSEGAMKFSAGPPIVECYPSSSATPTVYYELDFGRLSRSTALPEMVESGATTASFLAESLHAADCHALQVSVVWDTDQYDVIYGVTVPYSVREPR